MSSDSTDTILDPQEVVDQEGTVDAAVKKRILESRNAVNHNDNILFTERVASEQIQISEAQAVVAWGHSVKRYVRDVEILLRQDGIEHAPRYYEEIELGDVELRPPEDRYPFSAVYEGHMDSWRFKQQYGLPKGCDLPEPVTERFHGLRSIIESPEMLQHRWWIQTEGADIPGQAPKEPFDVSQPVPKYIYERALRETDQFLQEAGIGVETSAGAYESSEPLV